MTEEQRSETVNATNTLITNGLRLPKEYRIMVIEKLMQGIDKHEIITLLERNFGNNSQSWNLLDTNTDPASNPASYAASKSDCFVCGDKDVVWTYYCNTCKKAY